MDRKISLLPLTTSLTLNIAACNHLATMIIVVGGHKYCKKSQETIICSLLSIVENVFLELNGMNFVCLKIINLHWKIRVVKKEIVILNLTES